MAMAVSANRLHDLRAELRKVPAFFRRDLLTMWSYRMAFFSDWLNLIAQIALFWLIGRLVTPGSLPEFQGRQVTYLEFAAVGIAVTSFLQVALTRVLSVMRSEQLMGTLEYLLSTPTAPSTIQVGSVMYDIIYMPVRSIIFLSAVSILLGVDIAVAGILPALLVLSVFIPFVWGIGMVSAGAVLTFRRGSGVVGLAVVLLGIGSSTYVPLGSMPDWLAAIAAANPISVALDGIRASLLGNAGWANAATAASKLLPLAVISLALGVWSFRLALAREKRRGTLGQY